MYPVGHCTDYRYVGKNPGGELCDGDAGKDADEQLAAQSFLIPFLLRMGYASCGLWLIF
jgi:hypothetical protein